MPVARTSRRARLAALVSVVLAGTGVQLFLAPQAAQAASSGLIIAEFYGNGGNANAVRNADFVELWNPTGSSISLAGTSIQYRSAAGTAGPSGNQALSGSVAAGGRFLVQLSTPTANGAGLPTPDFTTAAPLNAGGTNGTVWLASTTSNVTLGTGSIINNASVIDLIGFGTSNTFETGAATGVSDNTKSFTRSNLTVDGDNNAGDFAATTPTPRNAAGETEPPSPATVTIATITAKTGIVDTPISNFTATATGGTSPYTWSASGMPPGVSIAPTTGVVSGTPTSTGTFNPIITAADAATPTAASDTETFAFTVSTPSVRTIAEIQGTGSRSSYAPANNATSASPANGQSVTTDGVITAVYTKGFNGSGVANCGFCGFYLQTGGSGGAVDATPGASDGIFVYGNPGFTGKDSAGTDLAVGQSVRVTGTVSEFSSSTTPTIEATTEITAAAAANIVSIATLDPIVAQTALPATYADREAHEGELFKPADLVITDTFNFETFGEFGLAAGGTPLEQPTEKCVASGPSAATCISDAQQELKDRGWFTEDGSSTTFMSGATIYNPADSANSDIPYPFITKDKSARVGAEVSYPQGGVLDFRNRKWYVQPPRAVISTHNGTPDLGEDVFQFTDTRLDNAAPADVHGDLKIATYNVENFFTLTGEAFADANPFYDCEYDYDRAGNPILSFQCESPQAIPDQWDATTNAPTRYKSGLVSSPRGAGTQASLDRQTAKIVNAINGLGADVVSLEELANPNKLRKGVTNGPLDPDTTKADSGFGTPIAWRDESIAYLVDHLNDDPAADGTWSFVASPEESTDATSVAGMCSTVQPNGQPVDGPAATAGTCSWASGQDVIRSGFLYKKETVVPVGPSDLDLPGSSAPTPSPFDNAREPLAQFFKPVGHPNSDGFAVIVNHFKSKGDSDPAATGGNANSALVGAFNASRVEQAKELLRFANEFADKWDTTKVFLVGDFNAYTGEDPVQTILTDPDDVDDLNFGLVESDDEEDLTYVFTANVSINGGNVGYGAAGSLDHVFASEDARTAITGTDVWEINSNEPAVYNYSRYDNNLTNFWDPAVPFGGSDHNPEIIGINVGGTASVKDIQIIGSNDFHGRMLGSSSDGGAAALAGAVESLKATWGEDNSVFAAAGDLIGASTFESFVQKDKPTLEALNAAGLEVSAVGNHEFDQGYEDLLDRVMKPYDATTNPYGAVGGLDWEYIGSNVVWETDPDGAGAIEEGDPIVLPTWTKEFGDGIKIGFVGAVTEDLMSLVNPAKMDGVAVTPIAEAVNEYASGLKAGADGVDLVVLLVHEGAPSTSCTTMDDPGSAFGDLLGDINPDIDAVISGHTHLEYSCSFPVTQWATEGKAITERPVVSAGQYGVALDQLVYSFDTATGEPIDVVANNVGVKGPGSTLFSFPEDPAVKAIVDAAVTAADGPGSVTLGKIGGAFKRARLGDAVTENRGGESTLGNLVAEIQRWATPKTTGINGAQIALMNPGGLRDDLNGSGDTFPKNVSYRAAAAVQPFANTLVNMDLTGAELEAVLEEQWQRDANDNVPSRPFLRLGTSQGFSYTYEERTDPDHAGATLGEVTGMWLNGRAIRPDRSYSVTVNSFLASGGDNFWTLNQGADKRDTGVTDLQAQVDYMAANASEQPLEVDFRQHAVRVQLAGGSPAAFEPGDNLQATLTSLAMTGVGDEQDTQVQVLRGTEVLGTFAVTNNGDNLPDDETGSASINVTLPNDLVDTDRIVVRGVTTGTRVVLPIAIDDGLPDTEVSAGDQSVVRGEDAEVAVTVDPDTATGTVSVLDAETVVGAPVALVAGEATVIVPAAQLSTVGAHELTVAYSGQAGVVSPSTSDFTVTVTKAPSTVVADDTSVVYGQSKNVSVSVTAPGLTPGGTVVLTEGATVLGSGPVTGGTATVPLAAGSLDAGVHTLTATYDGDADVEGGSDGLTLTVTKATPAVAAPDVTVPVGQTGTVSVTVTASGTTPSGVVTLKNGSTEIGNGTLTNGAVQIALPALPDGTVVTVDYSGSANVSQGTGSFTVRKGAKASPTVTATGGSTVVGAASTVSVQVGGPVNATGTVSVKNAGTTLGSAVVSGGVATVTLPARSLPVGSHTLSVEYSGDGNLNAATTTHSVTVAKAASATEAKVKPKKPTKRTKVKLEIKVEGSNGVQATGQVVITVAGDKIKVNLKSGKATVNLGKLARGTYQAKVTYQGDGNLEDSQDKVKIRVR